MSCPQCHRRGFHALTCPELETQVWIAFTVLTVGLGVFLIAWSLGGGQPHLILLGLMLWAAFGVSGLLLRRRRPHRDRLRS